MFKISSNHPLYIQNISWQHLANFDEMTDSAEFHLGLHFSSKYPITSIIQLLCHCLATPATGSYHH